MFIRDWGRDLKSKAILTKDEQRALRLYENKSTGQMYTCN